MTTVRILAAREVADRLTSAQSTILTRWEARLLDAFPSVSPNGHSALRNALPDLLERLATILRDGSEWTGLAASSAEHGAQRTQLPGYSLDQLFTEYKLLRQVLFDVLESPTATLDRPTQQLIAVALEQALRDAAVTFTELLIRREREATVAREHLLDVVSHDLRNPLQTLLTGSVLLLDQAESDDVADLLRRMQRAAQAATSLVNDLLDIAQIEAGGLAVVSAECPVVPLVADVVDRHALVCEQAGLRLETKTALPDDIAVLADRDQLHRVFDNLIRNATKFAPQGGQILLRAARDPEAVDCIRFTVADTGPGIPADEREHVFDRYWRGATKDRAGAGLGLAIARGIVEAHGGRIWLSNASDRDGATFHFTIPQVAPVRVAVSGDEI